MHSCVTQFLGTRGYSIAAYNYPDGLRLAEVLGYSLCVADTSIPGGSGIDLCRRIRTFNDKTPILVCSGSNELERPALEAGATWFVTKGGNLSFQLESLLGRLI